MTCHFLRWAAAVVVGCAALNTAAAPAIPRFSIDNMDRSVAPGTDFFQFAAGNWVRNNPVPGDKARWSGFDELQERNWFLLRETLEQASVAKGGPKYVHQVGDLFAAAMDTNRLERLGFSPIQADLQRVAALTNTTDLWRLTAQLHLTDVGSLFGGGPSADAKNSRTNAFHLSQGGLGLPDRDYYLSEGFAKQREGYRAHIVKMLGLLGDTPESAARQADTVLSLETELAKASKSRVELRDPNANYHKHTLAELSTLTPHLPWPVYFRELGLGKMPSAIVGQTNFFSRLDQLVAERPLADFQTYLRWHVLHNAASFLHAAPATETFAFYGTTLRGQPQQEPRWQRSAKLVDGALGEALGRMYVEKHFPPAARARMNELVDNLQAVFKDRLGKLEWMSEPTRQKALAKFDRFTRKIGHPASFRDYSKVEIRRDDYFGNIRRASLFENRRQIAQVGRAVDRLEWHMTPQTVNAYFNPLQNEIVFPAAILQPPFFDLKADDALNYGAIGVVIGHEITHGYDDQGRQFDAEGNLNDWWSESDAKEFEGRAKKLVDQFNSYEPLPGRKVNGQLTLGENIADLGGASVAYEALQRALAKDPAKRKNLDGFTPEQRFFISLAQLWRTNWREAELIRRLTVDPHSPGQYRAIGPHVNLPEFYQAFDIKPGEPMYRAPELRAKIW